MVMPIEVVLAVCIVLALSVQALHRAYFYLPVYELKRRAGRTTKHYKPLLLVARHGLLARALLAVVAYFFSVVSVIIISRIYDSAAAFGLLSVFVLLHWLVYNLPLKPAMFAAVKLAPHIDDIAGRLRPLSNRVRKIIRPRSDVRTDIFEKEDLRNFIKRQKLARNNRIHPEELDELLGSLDTKEKTVKDYMVEKAKVHFVTAKDPIGPILMSELHRSGFSCFPVKGNSANEIIGMLYIADLDDYKDGGTVGDAMDHKVYYVRDDYKLEQVLQAFNSTGRRVFVVVNMREKVVGLITVKDVLEQLVGLSAFGDFETYDDPEAIAHS